MDEIIDMIVYLQVFIPFLSLAINIVSQICIFRFIPRFSLLKSVFLSFLFGIGSLLFLEFYCLSQASLSLPEIVPSVVVNIIVYFALGYVYFHFINMGETARRIRILRELCDCKDGLSMDELLQRYNAKEIVARRVERLIANRQIICREGRYYINGRVMMWMAKIIVVMKGLLLGKRSEFD